MKGRFLVVGLTCAGLVSCQLESIPTAPTEQVAAVTPAPTPAPSPTPPRVTQFNFGVISRGASVGFTTTFIRNGQQLDHGGSRGFNIAAISPTTAELLHPVRGFDTWRAGADKWDAMTAYLSELPSGTLVLIAVGDEAGLTSGAYGGCYESMPPGSGSSCCIPLRDPFIESGRQALEALGARQIRSYCYRNSWAMIAVKGEGAKAENLSFNSNAGIDYTLNIP